MRDNATMALRARLTLLAALILAPFPAAGQLSICEDNYTPPPETRPKSQAELDRDALRERLMRYVAIEERHRMTGLASYYSASLDGTRTANGEIYRAKLHTAAHLTLPLGSWIEVRSRATGKKIR